MKFSNNSGPPFGSTLNGSGTPQLTLPFHLRSGQGSPSGQCLFDAEREIKKIALFETPVYYSCYFSHPSAALAALARATVPCEN